MTTPLPLLNEAPHHLSLGCLKVRDSQQARVLPLQQVRIESRVAAQLAEVSMQQRFANNLSQPLEAVYIFPLPEAAAVSYFALQAGEWRIEGQVQERQAARQAYQQALEQGPPAGRCTAVDTDHREVVFVVDRSDSMEGAKMSSASQACQLLLETLGPADRFAILAFDDSLDWFYPDLQARQALFLCADPTGQEQGQRFLRQLTARGGTELERALQEALQASQKQDEGLAQRVVVLLTDGQDW